MDNATLTAKMIDMALESGACAAGVTTIDTLAGGPPSTDLSYVLPGARSALTFALPLDQDKVEDYLAKRDRAAHQKDYSHTGTFATGLAHEIASYMDFFGHKSVGIQSNEVYRNDEDVQPRHMIPDISHRLLALRGGVAWVGLSGNVLTKDFGANVILATAVTTADLVPTDPLPAEETFCKCETMECVASCPSGFLAEGKKDMVTVTMGGVDFSYARRRHYNRCGYVCAGYSGLHASGKWSTWSPGRFPIPKHDQDLRQIVRDSVESWKLRPELPGGVLHQPLVYGNTGRDVGLTCGNCALVCSPDAATRKNRLHSVQNSGVVIQDDDGEVRAVSPDEARQHLDAMSPEQRATYEPEAGAYETIETYGRQKG